MTLKKKGKGGGKKGKIEGANVRSWTLRLFQRNTYVLHARQNGKGGEPKIGHLGVQLANSNPVKEKSTGEK